MPLRVSTDRPHKTSRGHIRRPKPAIVEASVSVNTMADIPESINVRRSDCSMWIEKPFVWYTVQRSGYPTVKIVIRERRANQLRAQSRKPLNCLARRRSYQRSRGTSRACRSTRWATGGGDKGMLRPTLWLLIILIIVKLSKQIRDVPNRMCVGY